MTEESYQAHASFVARMEERICSERTELRSAIEELIETHGLHPLLEIAIDFAALIETFGLEAFCEVASDLAAEDEAAIEEAIEIGRREISSVLARVKADE